MTVIAWDTETKLIASPDQIPPDLICGSFAEVDIAPQGTLLDASDACDLLELSSLQEPACLGQLARGVGALAPVKKRAR